eukprot:11156474-Lingulodinium_polyedra.AAC.1
MRPGPRRLNQQWATPPRVQPQLGLRDCLHQRAHLHTVAGVADPNARGRSPVAETARQALREAFGVAPAN